MRPRWLTLPGLLILALGIAGCGSGQGDVVTTGGEGPCNPHAAYGGFYPEHFLHWTPDGTQYIFDYAEAIYVVDAEGTHVRELVNANPRGGFGYGFYAEVSPDGTRVVYSNCQFSQRRGRPPNYEIAVINLDGTGQQRLTENSGMDGVPSWSPDGSRIAFNSHWLRTSGYDNELFTMAADGSNKQKVVAVATLREGLAETERVGGVVLAPAVWSPDGERLAFLVSESVWRIGGRWVLYTVRTDGTELTRIAAAVVPPVWSPDGEYLTFARASELDVEAGEWEKAGENRNAIGIYTVRPDGTDMRQVLAPQSEDWRVTQLAWSPDGSELLIVSDQQVSIFQADGTDLRSIDIPGQRKAWWHRVAWSPDGSRIAVYVQGRNTTPQLYTVAPDGTDRRDLIAFDADGNLVPANPSQETP